MKPQKPSIPARTLAAVSPRTPGPLQTAGALLTSRADAADAGRTVTHDCAAIDRLVGEARHEIRVRFAPAFAHSVEERPWQSGQLLEKLPDGGAEAIFRVGHPKPIEQRVLAAGGLAEVLSPPDVRERVRAAAVAVWKAHGGHGGGAIAFSAA